MGGLLSCEVESTYEVNLSLRQEGLLSNPHAIFMRKNLPSQIELPEALTGRAYAIRVNDVVKKDLRRMPGGSGMAKTQVNTRYVDVDLKDVVHDPRD